MSGTAREEFWAMPLGYHGKILRVDLSTRKIDSIGIDEQDLRKYFLGSGLAAKMLSGDFDNSLDPFDPAAPLLFFCGLFCATGIPAATKMSVCCRSPLTGIWTESTVGGHWPTEFRNTGWDGILFTGRADRPVYLHITTESIEIRPAEALWGLDVYETSERLRQTIDPKALVAAIGPAGERRVEISGIVFDPPNDRLAGRGGVGAVMGSKNLKALVAHAKPIAKLEYADRAAMVALLTGDRRSVREKTVGLYNFGTSGGVETVEMYGDLPIKNWQLGAWKEGAKKISGQVMQPMYLDHHYTCAACPIRCGKIYKSEELGIHGHGPEYETIGLLGANCLNDDPALVVLGNEWATRYGVDTISLGSAIGFAIEAFEKGAITEKDTGGLKLEWGGKSMLALVHKVGKGEDIGIILGKGVKRAAQIIGHDSDRYAVHTKGMEVPAHDPRGHVSMALNYATAVRGACHLEALTYFLERGIKAADLGYTVPKKPHVSDDKPPVVFSVQNFFSVLNPLGLCKFLFAGEVGPKKVAEWLGVTCGWSATMDEVMLTGERLFNLKRMYSVKLGISRKDDTLPNRLLNEAKPDGSAAGVLPDLVKMLDAYYELRGWSKDGIPTPAKLKELGLSS